MSRLADRVKKLEGNKVGNLHTVDCVVISPMSPDNMDREITALQGHSMAFDRVPDETEDDLLDRAWGLEPNSRLSCQAIVAQADLVVEIPKYSINHAKENH